MFKGAFTALVTPFKDDQVDYQSLVAMVNWQVEQGISGLVVCGSTGESNLLNYDEQKDVITQVVKTVNNRVPVIAGASAITTSDTIYLASQAESLGVRGLMIVTPPYVKPSQQAIRDYFTDVHNACSLPIILYDNPGRACSSIADETILKLAQLARVVALKDATGDLGRPVRLRAQLPEDFLLLSGEDITTPAFLAQGGDGVISVTANIAPKLVGTQVSSWQAKDWHTFTNTRDLLAPLHDAMFIESSPAPVKYALSLMNKCSYEVRKPLANLSLSAHDAIKNLVSNSIVLRDENKI